MRLVTIFALFLAAGAVTTYLWLGRHRDTRSEAVAGATAPVVTSEAHVAAPRPEPRDSTPAGAATRKADLRPARERLSREEARGLVERVFEGKLADRELTADDYEQLVDAVLRLRAALRVLRGADESKVSAAVVKRQREALRSIFDEMEEITGVPPSDLGDVLGSDDGPTGEENAGP